MKPESGPETEPPPGKLTVIYRRSGRKNILSGFVRVPEGIDLQNEWDAFLIAVGVRGGKATYRGNFYMWLAAKGVQRDINLEEEYRIRAQEPLAEAEEASGLMPVYINPAQTGAEPFMLT